MMKMLMMMMVVKRCSLFFINLRNSILLNGSTKMETNINFYCKYLTKKEAICHVMNFRTHFPSPGHTKFMRKVVKCVERLTG